MAGSHVGSDPSHHLDNEVAHDAAHRLRPLGGNTKGQGKAVGKGLEGLGVTSLARLLVFAAQGLEENEILGKLGLRAKTLMEGTNVACNRLPVGLSGSLEEEKEEGADSKMEKDVRSVVLDTTGEGASEDETTQGTNELPLVEGEESLVILLLLLTLLRVLNRHLSMEGRLEVLDEGIGWGGGKLSDGALAEVGVEENEQLTSGLEDGHAVVLPFQE